MMVCRIPEVLVKDAIFHQYLLIVFTTIIVHSPTQWCDIKMKKTFYRYLIIYFRVFLYVSIFKRL